MSNTKPQLPSPRVLFPHLFPGPLGQQQPAASVHHTSQALPTCQSLQRGSQSHVPAGTSPFSHPPYRGVPPSAMPPSSTQNGYLRPADWAGSSSAASPIDKKRYPCGECGKRFERPSSLETHMHSHTGERPFKCTYHGCEKMFSTRSNMQRHLRTSH
ncbi:hypothetical protein PHLGIDRAFT_296537 [Phlebiopsis gigantea 11061_1 CR5-6]|uniref:C2H2-type domain-containing protein n=1 Tax=Phlebiopsis gigantea (strain 11061_1 CR5-6) TaxID=745531 RepID=A0A0C3SBA7_PHLG1|nr:hypothetical protein PHLGIDRAFT_296537 [Phlebiopsis gigantea 11061_1 CR5-6]